MWLVLSDEVRKKVNGVKILKQYAYAHTLLYALF